MTDGDFALVEDHLKELLDRHPPSELPAPAFWGAQFDLGLAWVEHPVGLGGLGVSRRWQPEINRQIVEAGGSIENRFANVVGVGMSAATLVTHASADTVRRFLRPMFTTEEFWCQLFSEPGAGSDLAGLSTMAVRDGDDWIINGQKVWTSLAHKSRWGLLLARTDPDVPKHRGLTFFVVDMGADGVEVRPLYQLTGEAEFNEVYLTDVRVPDSLRIGDVGGGWAVAMTTLANERVAVDAAVHARGDGAIAHAMAAWARRRDHDEALRDQLLSLWIEAEAVRLTGIRSGKARTKGDPGADGSVFKLYWSELNKAITSFAVDLLGAEGMMYPGGYTFTRPERMAIKPNNVHQFYLHSQSESIAGGTSEIMKNIIGEQLLGLPREPRTDKKVPWREIPRN